VNTTGVGAPFLPLLLTIFISAAVASFVLRMWARWTALGGALLAALLGFFIWQIDFNTPLFVAGAVTLDLTAAIERFGYTFQLQQSNMPVLALSLLILACALLLAARPNQPPTLPAFAWALVTGYALLALMVSGPKSPLFGAPLFLGMLTALGVFVLHSAIPANPAGALRTLIPPLLGALLFLLAAWYIDQMPLNPQDVSLPQTAGALLGFGLLLLLAPFPLHSATPAAAESAPPPAMLLVTLLYQLAVLHLTAQVLSAYPFVAQQTDWPVWLSWLGLLTTVWGGLAALGALNAGRLWGYAALCDWGLIIVVLAAPGLRSWTLVLFLFSLRIISMFTAAAGLTTLEDAIGSLDMARLRGVGSRLSWNSAAVLLGGLGLIGFPLTAGFAGHWAALLTLAQVDWRPAAVVLVASVGAFVGYLRMARLMFGYLENRSIPREQTYSTALAIGALVVTIAVAVAPQLLSDFITRALAAFG
jgi:formate hydrogenlyase subunit 3/multisubunit Na+/H+ antiporter MnhD subunit